MTDSGIDTNIFKPYSVRGVSTSALYQRGASLTETRWQTGHQNAHLIISNQCQ